MGKINAKVINALPLILKRLSNCEDLCTVNLSSDYDVHVSTLRDNINKYIVSAFPSDISFSRATNTWTSNRNFLADTLLSPEEIITMKILEKNVSQYGDKFEKNAKLLFNRFKRRASLQIYKKTNFEKITREYEATFAIIKNAIKFKSIVTCVYKEKKRTLYPLKIVMFDGYWYALVYQENEKTIKTFHLKSISQLETTTKQFTLELNDINLKLDSAINAHFKDKKLFQVELLVHKKIIKYFERRPLSKNQDIFDTENDDYKLLRISITDDMEIIPTIQQFMPFIKPLSPSNLIEKLDKHIIDYRESDLSHYP